MQITILNDLFFILFFFSFFFLLLLLSSFFRLSFFFILFFSYCLVFFFSLFLFFYFFIFLQARGPPEVRGPRLKPIKPIGWSASVCVCNVCVYVCVWTGLTVCADLKIFYFFDLRTWIYVGVGFALPTATSHLGKLKQRNEENGGDYGIWQRRLVFGHSSDRTARF